LHYFQNTDIPLFSEHRYPIIFRTQTSHYFQNTDIPLFSEHKYPIIFRTQISHYALYANRQTLFLSESMGMRLWTK